MVVPDYDYDDHRLAYLEPGSESWTIVESPLNIYRDVIWYNNHFYVVGYKGWLMICKTNKGDAKLKLVTSISDDNMYDNVSGFYLVESEGKLLMVTVTTMVTLIRTGDSRRVDVVELFDIIQLDLSNDGETIVRQKKVRDIGNRAIFIGPNSYSTSIEVFKHSECKPNCIYYVNHRVKKLQIYNVKDGSVMWEPYTHNATLSMWLTLDF